MRQLSIQKRTQELLQPLETFSFMDPTQSSANGRYLAATIGVHRRFREFWRQWNSIPFVI